MISIDERRRRGTDHRSMGLSAMLNVVGKRLLKLICALLLLGVSVMPLDAAARTPPPIRITLLPVETINIPQDEGIDYGKLLRSVLKRGYRLKLQEAPELVSALKSQEPSCRAEVNCLRKICSEKKSGKEPGKKIEKLLALRVGRLSDTLVIRLAVFDIPRGVLQGTWQEVLNQSDPQAITRAMERMVLGFTPQREAANPWYGKWWVWTVAGAVVAGSVTAAILATRDTETPPDNIIVLPSP